MTIREYLKLKDKNKAFRDLFRKAFNFKPGKVKLYKSAFVHKSVDSKTESNNERLEFLGDAILSAVISELCFVSYPEAREGFLTQMRSKIVNREFLNDISMKMGIENFIEYDKNINLNSDFINDIFGNCLEALIGAIYIDKGYTFTRKYILNSLIDKYVDIDELKSHEKNYKGKLFELAQHTRFEIQFITEESRKKHETVYTAKVQVDGKIMGEGISTRKKKAEQEAAKIAYDLLMKSEE